MRTESKNEAFTLVELSIVIIVFALITGSVIVGKSLLYNAKIRATLSQVREYQDNMQLFNVKYGGLPGDLNSVAATRFNFTTRTGAIGHGDGDGAIDSCSKADTITKAGCESLLFWRDLYDAKMIDARFSSATDAVPTIASTAVTSYFPITKLKKRSMVHVFYAGQAPSMVDGGSGSITGEVFQNGNSIAILGINRQTTTLDVTPSLTPTEAKQLDGKIDDGLPASGTILANNSSGGSNGVRYFAYNSTSTCVVTTGGSAPYSLSYNSNASYRDKDLCNLMIKMQ